MLRLIVWNSAETAQHSIELYDHAPVNLNYQFADVTEINKTQGSYSQTFRIPATKQNKDFFGSIDKPNIEDTSDLIISNYSVNQKIKAALSYNTIPLMNGYVQIKAVYIQKKDFSDIELIFFGDTIDLATALKEKKIADLTTTSIDHTLNYANLIASMGGSLKSGNVVYGFMDKGRNWSFAYGQTPPYTSTLALFQGDFTPYVRAKWLIDTIMSEAGYTYDSTLFDSADFLQIYLPAYNGSITPRSDNNSSETEVAAGGVITTQGPLTATYVSVQFNVAITGGYDYGGNVNPASNRYVAPYTGLYTITLCFRTLLQPPLQTPACDFRHNGTSVFYFEGQFTHTFSITLDVGDYLEMFAKKAGGLSETYLKGSSVGSNDTTWFRIDSVSEPLQGQAVKVSSNFPDIKQIDFLMGLQKMFNLVFIPDNRKPKHLIIEPMQDYVATGTKKDWTNKVDYNKDVVITPTTDIQRNLFDWENSAGQDFINVAVQESVGRIYGRHRIEDKDNDFATGDAKVQTQFAPYILSNIPSSSIAIHRCIDKEGKGVQSPKARLAYFNGVDTSVGDVYVYDDTLTSTNIGYLPNFSNYNAIAPTVPNNDLNFGYERAFIFLNSHPVNTQYYRYWMGFVNELYSADSRLLTAYVKLTRADIQDFEFSDRIYIKDTYYRILKISNYDATTGGVVKVDFIKILSDVADCADLPTGQRTIGAYLGAITFNGGALDYGSQACCERYGYVWFPDKAGGNPRCYPSTFIPTPNIT
tara:strand:- start:2818 stop:5082 length:2265 start_codon:yes stop_codon:yes gene_type:complete